MKKLFNRLNSVAITGVTLFLLSGGQVNAAGSQALQGHVPKAVARLQSLRHFEGTNHLKLAIGLPLRDKEGLTNLLQQLYDPASPNYHKYLTASEFAKRFGPTEADYQTLRAFAVANNLGVIGSHPNRVLLDVEGSVADIEKALHTSIQVYRHPTENREFFAPATEPSVDLDLPILHISGLDNFMVPHPMIHKMLARPAGATPTSGSAPGGNYLGYDFRNAYIPGVTLTGTGQIVGLVEFGAGFFQSDITAYENLAGLPNVPVVPVLLDGYDGGEGNVDGNGEVSLDIEMAISMAPGLSEVLVYEGELGDDVLNRIATDNTAKQIGASWAGYSDAASDQIFLQYATQGQSFYNACGDGDAWVGTIYPPCDDPNITIVGGTTLSTTGPGGAWTSETVWNWGYNPPGWIPGDQDWGSGGGISTVWSIPSWQNGISMVANQGSTTMRNVPDVALTANEIWVLSGDGQSGSYGGTSCATPLWAAFTALVNQQAAANGEQNQGFINPALYTIGKGSSYTSCFRDTVTGNNFWSNSPTTFAAVSGYDLCTGWGTPNGSNLINALAPVSFTPVLTVATNIISGGNGNGVIDFDECNNLTIILTNSGGVAATGIEATLSSTTIGAIVAQGTSAYPTIPSRGSAPNLSYFTLSTEPTFVCGTPVNLVLVVKYNQLVQTNNIQLPSGVVGTPDSFTSSTSIPIPSTGTPVNSPIVVSGLQAVGKVTVSVFLAAASDFGVSLELLGPNGTNVILAQNNGGFGPNYANYGGGCTQNAETTFDDAAPVSITLGSAPFIGSYAPQQPLSIYHLMSGTNLNGTWNLQVVDEFPGDTAVLGCWSLNISPEVCLDGGGQCSGADLSLMMSASPSPVYVNSNLVYTLTVSNAGPSTADNILITQTLPAGVNFVTTSGYTASASTNGMNLNLNMGSLPVYGSATISVITTVTPNVTPGLISSSAVVGSAETDPNLNNNTASASVMVTEPLADLAVSMSGAPGSVLQNGLLTYTINVTNNGPFTAFNVTNVTTLPPNVNIISHTVTQQGTLTVNGLNEVVTTWNSLGLGSNAVVTIVVSPTFTGNIAANTQVVFSPLEVDPNLFNNTASVSTTVGQAADLSVAAFTIPSLVLAGSNVNYIVTVSNAGASTATNVVFTQSLPSQSTFVTNNWPTVTVTNNNLINITFTNDLAAGRTLLITNVIKSPTLLFGVKSNSMTSTFSVFGQPGDPNTNNNTLTLVTTEEPATVTIVAAGAILTSGSANGSVGTNGTYGVEFFLQNVGNIPTSNLVATLQTNSGLTPVTGSNTYTYGVLQPEAAPTNGQFEFTASSTNGGTIYAVLQLQDGSTNLGLITNTFIMPLVQTFSTNRVIFIPNPTNSLGHPNTDEIGPGYPYPSTIIVSNVNGNVSKVTVTISNLTHAFASDVGLLLVGPSNSLNTNGVNCVLMSAVGYATGILAPITLTFDQSASSQLPGEYGEIVPGTYQPTDYYTSVYGTAEAYTNSLVPVGPYNTNLTVFNSFPANGTWNLYAYDFAVGDAGEIANGWSLSITTITPVNLTDVAATMVSLTNSVYLGANITNVWTVTNNGPNTTTAYVTNILPAGLTFVSSTLAPTTQTGQTNVYYLVNFASGSNVVVTNVVATTNATSGPQTNIISVGSSVLDTNLVNNTAFAVTTLVPPPVGLALAPISINPNTTNAVAINSSLVYTLFVTNNGPSNAFNVIGSFALSGLQFDSILYPLDAAYTLSNGVVQCDLGTISAGSVDEFEIMATATNIGVVTNVWSVTTTSGNTNSAGNFVSAIVKVTNAMPAIAIASVTLQPPNYAIYSNQTNTVSLTLTNGGWAPTTTNFTATLQTNSGVTPVAPGSVIYGVITNGGPAENNSFTFISSGSPGSTITAVWSLQDGTNFLGTVSNSFLIPPTAMSFNNTGAIYIPAVGQAQPYPSTIQVSVPTNLLVSKVTVTLNGFKHSFPHDVEAMLVSPAGQGVLLMASTGGPYNVSNLVLTFDDAVTNSLPTNGPLYTGTFLATSNSPFYSLPNLPTLSGTGTNLAYLNGISPNGASGWSLYVYDDTSGNDGAIVNGWSLGLTLIDPVDPAARLVVSTVETPSPVVAGDYVTNQVTVYNSGPDTATGVTLTNILTSSNGVPVITNLYLGTIAAFNQVTTNFIVQTPAGARGFVTNTAFATASDNADLSLADSTNVTITPVLYDPVPAPAVSMVGGVLHLTVNGYPGELYVIQATTNMAQANGWVNIYTNAGIFTYTNTGSHSQRFYRILHQPQ